MIGTSGSVLAPALPWQYAQLSTNLGVPIAQAPDAIKELNKALQTHIKYSVALCFMIPFSKWKPKGFQAPKGQK
jgi:hypothetical protein